MGSVAEKGLVKVYTTGTVWGQETQFSSWEEFSRAVFAEARFVGALLQKILFSVSIAYWNVNQAEWGQEFDGPLFPIEMGELRFTDEGEDFLALHFKDASFSIEKGKPRRDPRLAGNSRTAEAWARWFLECEMEISRHNLCPGYNLCHGYCEERHMLKDCRRSLARPEYSAGITAITLVR